MPKLSISEAAHQWGKSRTTLYKAINSGELSTVGKGKTRKIDVSEMIRVYGEEQVNSTGKTNVDTDVRLLLSDKEHKIALLEQKIEHLEEQLRWRDEQNRPFTQKLIRWMKG